MEFTEAYKQAGPCCFSPDSRFLAVAVDYRLVIRDVQTLKVIHLYSCVDKISYIEWAVDSEYILCGVQKRAVVQAWSVAQPEWTCKIDEGLAGISFARWSPDSRHILTISDFQLRLTVWSLLNTTASCVHLNSPKHSSKSLSFTRDGKFAAISTRTDCKDYINLLSCRTWEIMGSFAVDTIDLSALHWSPDDTSLLVSDSPLHYKVLIYSPDGRCLFKYQPYESGLGVKTVSWSPCGQFLAIGSYDQMLRILNHLTWKSFAELMHAPVLRNPCTAVVFKEVDEPLQLHMSELYLRDTSPGNRQGNDPETAHELEGHRVKYKVMNFPVTLPYQKPAADKPNPKQGIGLLSWSSDSQYIFSRNDCMPNVLWVWHILHLEIAAVLIQKEAIQSATWHPKLQQIFMCTGTSHLYIWSPSGACCVCVPLPNFVVSDLKWNSNGSRLFIKDREHFCCASVMPMLPDSSEDTSETSDG